MSDPDLKKQYQWQCRRGLKEVEVVLNDYLERFFDSDSAELKSLFGTLLAEQDADMFEWFTGRSAPQDAALAEYVQQMLARLRRTA